MSGLLRDQAGYCRDLGSPFYGVLLDLVADDVDSGGPAAAVLAGYEDDPGPSALALRLAGSVQALVLSGRAPDAARHYPSTGGDGDARAAWKSVRTLLAEQPGAVRERLDAAPQTNETGRAAALWGGVLQVLADLGPMPVRLWEIGAAGGLNLRADRFRYTCDDGAAWGDAGSPVLLAGAWSTVPRDAPERVEVVERLGIDVTPLDPTDAGDALTLQSYVWPDQQQRLERLRAALTVAAAVPATVRRGSAAELVETFAPRAGTLGVLWHSVMWQYLAPDERSRVLALLAEAGAAASMAAPLAHVSFEPRRPTPRQPHEFVITVRTWPGGQERILGSAPPHGVPVTWRR